MEEIVLPKWGVTMQEATVTEWLVSVGDRIEVGQPVATVETDKVDGEVESPAAGMITEILVEAGQHVLFAQGPDQGRLRPLHGFGMPFRVAFARLQVIRDADQTQRQRSLHPPGTADFCPEPVQQVGARVGASLAVDDVKRLWPDGGGFQVLQHEHQAPAESKAQRQAHQQVHQEVGTDGPGRKDGWVERL